MLDNLIQNERLRIFLMALLIIGMIFGTISLFATIKRSKKTFDQILSAFDRISMSDATVKSFRMQLTAYDNSIESTGVYKWKKDKEGKVIRNKKGKPIRVLVHSRFSDGRVSKNIKTETIIRKGYGIVAVDTKLISLGSIILWNEHKYIAIDTGGAIRGNKIDIWHKTHKEARKFGVKRNRWITVVIPKWKDRAQLVYYLRKYDKEIRREK